MWKGGRESEEEGRKIEKMKRDGGDGEDLDRTEWEQSSERESEREEIKDSFQPAALSWSHAVSQSLLQS